MAEPLVPPTFLFRYAAPCYYLPATQKKAAAALGEEYRLPSFLPLDGGPEGPDTRAGWNESGITLSVRVTGKKQLPWCRDNRIEDSDGFHVWIDTRDTHNIHRAGRFCHCFVFMPTGGGNRLDEPVGDQLLINRARENAKAIRPGVLTVRSEKRGDGYILEAVIPAAALTGFDPVEHPKLGFTCAVIDREIGELTFNCGPEFSYRDDPSLWATLELIKDPPPSRAKAKRT